MQVSDEGGQGCGEGQEQGVDRLGWKAGAQADRVQTRAAGARLEAASKPRQSQGGSVSWMRVACLVDGAHQKLKLMCFFYETTFVN